MKENIKKPKRHQLVSLRFDFGLSQSELAEMLGVSQMTISRIEQGKKEIEWELRRKIEDAFGIDMD
ncbi:helix-turn-helix transcriptional regulator [Peribacillus sp. JNUCC 23]|uniref:helix-turn-helix transcriptional regulator n=1 Tax=Peribacillus loiseleuriae TaxID=1679170 RepID=UPI003D053351